MINMNSTCGGAKTGRSVQLMAVTWKPIMPLQSCVGYGHVRKRRTVAVISSALLLNFTTFSSASLDDCEAGGME